MLKSNGRYASDDSGAGIWDIRLFLSISAISLILVGAHNDDLVVAGAKLYKPLPRTDGRFAGKAVILVLTTIGNINFPHEHSSYWKI